MELLGLVTSAGYPVVKRIETMNTCAKKVLYMGSRATRLPSSVRDESERAAQKNINK